jgi:hypothetical protein
MINNDIFFEIGGDYSNHQLEMNGNHLVSIPGLCCDFCSRCRKWVINEHGIRWLERQLDKAGKSSYQELSRQLRKEKELREEKCQGYLN